MLARPLQVSIQTPAGAEIEITEFGIKVPGLARQRHRHG
ncbi:hypothetical protein N183_30855 [Sinorhizobium sp. Sb3]|nr:hypothetical protein N183_30855 [Sinorhizobium sp. Sb3]